MNQKENKTGNWKVVPKFQVAQFRFFLHVAKII